MFTRWSNLSQVQANQLTLKYLCKHLQQTEEHKEEHFPSKNRRHPYQNKCFELRFDLWRKWPNQLDGEDM